MARYRLLEAAIIDNVFHDKGEEVEWDGEPGPHMELIEGQAPKPAEKPAKDPNYPSEEPGTGRRK